MLRRSPALQARLERHWHLQVEATFGGMDVLEAKRLKRREDENRRLKRVPADAMPAKATYTLSARFTVRALRVTRRPPAFGSPDLAAPLIVPVPRHLFLFSRNHVYLSHPASAGGACRDRHETWAVGCDGRRESQRGFVSRRRTVRCARRSRAVLTPRCWCPAASVRKRAVAHGGQQARCTRETTYKPFQPSRGEGRACPARPVVTAACFFCCRRATGAASARPSPRPPLL